MSSWMLAAVVFGATFATVVDGVDEECGVSFVADGDTSAGYYAACTQVVCGPPAPIICELFDGVEDIGVCRATEDRDGVLNLRCAMFDGSLSRQLLKPKNAEADVSVDHQ